MPWVRLDEQFARNPKVLMAGPLGMAMQVAALCYCNEYLTDGFVPRSVANTLLDFEGLAFVWTHNDIFGGGDDVEAAMVVKMLVEAGVWDEAPGGYQIHDYLEYQPSKAEVLAQREQRVEAGRQGGLAKAKRGAKQTASEVLSEMPSKTSSKTLAKSYPVPVPDLEEAKASSRKGLRDSEDPDQINRDGIWTALEDLFGKATTRTERSLRGRLVKSLTEADATYTAVKERSAKWPNLFPGRNGPGPTLTAPALEKWWGALGLLVATEELRVAPCSVCDSRRIVGLTEEGEIVKVDDPRAIANERCVCVA